MLVRDVDINLVSISYFRMKVQTASNEKSACQFRHTVNHHHHYYRSLQTVLHNDLSSHFTPFYVLQIIWLSPNHCFPALLFCNASHPGCRNDHRRRFWSMQGLFSGNFLSIKAILDSRSLRCFLLLENNIPFIFLSGLGSLLGYQKYRALDCGPLGLRKSTPTTTSERSCLVGNS